MLIGRRGLATAAIASLPPSPLSACELSLTLAFFPGAVMFSNILIICTMSIQGKSLAGGTSHDEMVESFGLTWLLAGTSLGHVVGAGAILGCQAGGFPGL